jgi:hypothetical protein
MKKTKFVTGLWCVALALMAIIGSASAIPSINVEPASNSVIPGQNFTVNIAVNPDTSSVYSGSFKLLFNPAMLKANKKAIQGAFLTQDGESSIVIVNKFDNINGTIDYGETRAGVLTGVNTAGNIASIEFHVLETAKAGMSSNLGLTEVSLVEVVNDNPVEIPSVNVNNGSAVIPCNVTVKITSPAQNEVLHSKTVNVKYVESGCVNTVSHADLQLDNGAVIHDNDNDGNYTINDAALGAHQLKVWLVDTNEVKLNGAEDVVDFSIALKSPKISVIPASQNAYIGDTVTVQIQVNPDSLEVYGGQFDLSYVASKLNATSIVKGPFLTQDGASSIVVTKKCDNSINKCEYGETRIEVTNGVTTTGILATITFRADALGTVLLNLGNVSFANPDAAPIEGIVVTNGEVKIIEEPQAFVAITLPLEGEEIQGQTIAVKYNETGYLAKVSHADLKLDNGAIIHDSDNDGNYVFNNVAYGAHTVQVWLVNSAEAKVNVGYDVVNFTNVAPKFGPKLNVTPAYSIVHAGDIIKINITLNPDTKKSYAAAVKLNFDTTMLEALNVVQGAVLSQDGADTIVGTKKFDNVLGTAEYSESRAATDTGILNPGTLFQIWFKVKSVPRGSIGIIDLVSGDVLSPDLLAIPGVTLNDGKVEIPLNVLPVAIAKTSHLYNTVGYKVYLNGSESYDPDGSIVKFEWEFDDGTANGLGPVVNHVYSAYRWNGSAYQPYIVKLTVTDNDAAVSSQTIEIVPWMAGDTNGDGKVDIIDLATIGKSWNTKYPDVKYSDGADMNNDNAVNVLDLVILGLNWGNVA